MTTKFENLLAKKLYVEHSRCIYVFIEHFSIKYISIYNFNKLYKQKQVSLKTIYMYMYKIHVFIPLPRWPIDRFEEYTTSLADLVVVNSHYTKNVFRNTFVHSAATHLEVLYPTVNFALYDAPMQGDLEDIPLMKTSKTTFLSLNRFERKKDIGLAIAALGEFSEVNC